MTTHKTKGVGSRRSRNRKLSRSASRDLSCSAAPPPPIGPAGWAFLSRPRQTGFAGPD